MLGQDHEHHDSKQRHSASETQAARQSDAMGVADLSDGQRASDNIIDLVAVVLALAGLGPF